MTTSAQAFADLSDGHLLAAVHRLATDERRATVRLITSLVELDQRRLYLAEGYSSLFTYCTQVLHLSEHAAYGRIEAARVVRKYPVLLERLETGDLTLTTMGLLAPHLTSENYLHLVETARHKSKRDVEHLVAALRPQPAVPTVARKLPSPKSERPPEIVQPSSAKQPLTLLLTTVSSAPGRTESNLAPARVTPLAAERYKVQFTVTKEVFEKLRRVQDLMRHSCPDGDVAIVFERGLTMLLQHLEKTTLASVSRPQRPRGTTSDSRRIPSAVRRAVWARDNGQCAFMGTLGRCTERGFLEFHHAVPSADGGAATSITSSCDVGPTISMSRTDGSVRRSHPSCVSAATSRAGRTRSGPSRRFSHLAPCCPTSSLCVVYVSFGDLNEAAGAAADGQRGNS